MAVTFALPHNLGHGLTEVNMDPPVVNQNIVHLEIGILTILFLQCK